MSHAAALLHSRSAGRQARLVLDPVIVTAVLALLLAGLVMVTSASLNVAERASGDPFFHFERQLLSVLLGATFAGALLVVPVSAWQRVAPWLLLASFVLLLLVLVPGLGHEVNGSRRWIRIGPLNFQPSEPARWMLLTYVAVFYLSPADRWWGQDALLEVRWSLSAAAVTLVAILIHGRRGPKRLVLGSEQAAEAGQHASQAPPVQAAQNVVNLIGLVMAGQWARVREGVSAGLASAW